MENDKYIIVVTKNLFRISWHVALDENWNEKHHKYKLVHFFFLFLFYLE